MTAYELACLVGLEWEGKIQQAMDSARDEALEQAAAVARAATGARPREIADEILALKTAKPAPAKETK